MSCTGDANDGNHGMGSQRRYESVVNDQSIEMNGNSMFISGWDHLGGSSMVTQNHYSFVPGNQVVGTSSHMIQSDSSFFESGSQFTCLGSGNFSEMMGSFCQDVGSQIGNAGYPPNYALNKQDHSERAQMVIRNDIQILEDQQLSAAATSLNGKRRRRGSDSDSSFDPNQSLEAEPPKNSGAESSDIVKEEVEKKAKFEQNSDAKLRCKQAAKQGKDNLQGGEAPKENYIHVRARRGQATNSHSLAERVRREKISERMRLLQELVPGCNKITGKAVMLDEIINYVQSLQQQVEFLSMKLATVNPDVNIDIETILSKDVLHSRSTNAAILGLNPSLNTHSYGHRYFQASIPAIPNTNMQFPPLSNSGLEDEFQTLFQMGFNPNPAIDSLGPNGRLKPEL